MTPRTHTHKKLLRAGIIAVQVALSLTALMAILAVAVDGGLMLAMRRQAQAAADAGALAAAAELYNNYGTNNGDDTGGTAAASAKFVAQQNGADSANVVVNDYGNNYSGGPNKGTAIPRGYIEVTVTMNQTRYFSNVFGTGAIPITARAVAKGQNGNVGILMLDLHLKDSTEIDGNVNILNGGQIYSNSDNTVTNDSPLTGSVYVASTATINTSGINAEGALNNAGGTINYQNGGSFKTYTTDLSDPYASIPEPTTSGLTNRGAVTINSNTTLQPGIYTGITITSGTVTMAPGIYYLNAGSGKTQVGLEVNGGSLSGTGVMLFNNTGGDDVLNKASGVVNLTPPTASSGGTWPTGTTSATYNGISYWVPRASTSEYHVESTANLTMPGTWYAAGGEFDIRPDGSSTVFNIGNYIADQAEWGQGYDNSKGKSNGTINMNPTTGSPTLRPALVE